MMVSSSLIAAFLAGLLGSVHCVGMCGAFAASCTRARGGLLAWHLGRVGTYTLLGAVAGSVGRVLPGPPWVPAAFASLLLVWFALALAGLVPEPRLLPPGLQAAGARAAAVPTSIAQLLFGVANGFLPCGLVYSALSIPVALASPRLGAAAMAAFGAGTLPALSLAAVGMRRFVLGTLWRRRGFAALILVTGIWTIWQRASAPVAAMNHHDHHQSHDPVPPPVPERGEE
jgi:sulfite exporter TauE/SafE